MGYSQTYAIGESIPSSIDYYNLREDSDTIIAIAEILSEDIETETPIKARVVGYAEINDYGIDIFEPVDVDSVIGVGSISFSSIKYFYDFDTIIGASDISSIEFVNLENANGIVIAGAEITPDLGIERITSSTAFGVGRIFTKEDFISPNNAYVCTGVARIFRQDKAFYQNIVSSTGIAEVIATREGAKFKLYSGSDGASSLSGIDLSHVVGMDSSIVNEGSVSLNLDNFVKSIGEAYIFAQNSSHLSNSGTVLGEGVISAHVGTTIDGGRIDLYGNPIANDAFVIGHELITEETMPYVVNAPEFSTVFSAFQYSISAIEDYQFSTVYVLSGVSSGQASCSASMDIAMATNLIVAETTISVQVLSSTVTRYPATVTAASGDGTYITYTANNSFTAGQKVTVVNDVTPSTSLWWEVTDEVIYSASSTQFVITNSGTGTFSSANAKALVGYPYYGDVRGAYY